jgi:GDP-mannose 6-dehydrogenase
MAGSIARLDRRGILRYPGKEEEVSRLKIAVFGLGYVGMVTAACLAEKGHSIVGVEIDREKLEKLNRGDSPIIENGLSDLVRKGIQSGQICVSSDSIRPVQETDLAIVCVGTPGQADGNLDLTYLQNVAAQIGSALKDLTRRYTVVIRSTLLPGTTSKSIIPILQDKSGKLVDRDFDVCVYPEFMREGTSIDDFYSPPLVVVGVRRSEAALPVLGLYTPPDSPLFVTSIETSEMIKCTCNAFHALKVAFANEIGSLCKHAGIDGREVMEILCADRKLNISPSYLKPAFAFGGSCLPKDVKALEYHAGQLGCQAPLLGSIIPSNRCHVEKIAREISNTGCRSIGLLGLSFKAGSDDLRESPLVALARLLLDRGFVVRILDTDIRLSSLIGANRRFIANRLPDISQCMTANVVELVHSSELIVLGKLPAGTLEQLRNVLREDHVIVDLIGIVDPCIRKRHNYIGACW